MTPLKLGRANLRDSVTTQSVGLLIICCLLVVFPWGNPAVPHAGSTVYTILLLGGLTLGWKNFADLRSEERYMLFAYVGFAGIMALTLVNTENRDQGIKHLERYVRFAGMLPVCLLLRRHGASASKAFLAGCTFAGPVLAIQAWYQTQIQGLELARGAYHHIVFGDLAALAVAIVIAGLITLGRKWWHYALGLLSVSAGIVATLFAGERNAWLFLALLALMLPWLYRRALGGRRLMAMACIFVLFIVAVAIWKPPLLVGRLADGFDDLRIFWHDPSSDTSLGARLNMWRNSVVIFSQSPLVGTGIGDFRTDSTELVEKGLSYGPTIERFSHAHNIYFHALAETGIIGLAALIVSLFVLPLRYFYTRWRDATNTDASFFSLAGLVSVFGFAVFGIGEAWFVRNPPVNAYIVSVAVFIAGLIKITSELRGQRHSP